MDVRVVKLDAREVCGTALVGDDGSVWVLVSPPWWDFATRLWYWLAQSDFRRWAVVRTARGSVRARAVRVAKRHVVVRTVE